LRTHDAIIIGGGHNGLACAAYLARAGMDVLVLERKNVLGGASVTEERWPGYHISSAAYVVSLMPPQVVRELELERFGYRATILDPDYWAPFPDGTSLTLWGDLQKATEEIAKFSKKDAAAYLEFDKYFSRLGQMLKDLLFVIPPNLTLRDAPRLLAVAAKLRHWSARDISEIVRLFTISGMEFLDEWFEDERVKGALGTQTILGAWCGPMSPGSAYVLLHHWIGEVDGRPGAWGWVHGGMGALSQCIADSARAAGATIRDSTPVKRVVVIDGRAAGVELEDGSVLHAKQVISNAHPITTYLDLIGEENLSDEVVRDVRRSSSPGPAREMERPRARPTPGSLQSLRRSSISSAPGTTRSTDAAPSTRTSRPSSRRSSSPTSHPRASTSCSASPSSVPSSSGRDPGTPSARPTARMSYAPSQSTAPGSSSRSSTWRSSRRPTWRSVTACSAGTSCRVR
jgi:phytoene dehydrogenase-like protein